jgi:hypothetical protein
VHLGCLGVQQAQFACVCVCGGGGGREAGCSLALALASLSQALLLNVPKSLENLIGALLVRACGVSSLRLPCAVSPIWAQQHHWPPV